MERKTSIFLVILLCILVAVGAGGTSYLVLANAHDQETQSLNDQVNKLEDQIQKLQKEAKPTAATTSATTTTTSPTTTTTATTDPTAGWQTYDSKSGGESNWLYLDNGSYKPESSKVSYSLKFPNNWTVNKWWENNPNVPAVYGSSTFLSNNEKIGETSPGPIIFSAGDSCFSKEKFVENNTKINYDKGPVDVISFKNFNLNGVTGKKLITKVQYEVGPDTYTSWWYPRDYCIQTSPAKGFKITFYDSQAQSTNDTIFDNIVSTFKFSN